jgi:hypothetical protein
MALPQGMLKRSPIHYLQVISALTHRKVDEL